MKPPEFHHTPKHASWLNMAETEFCVLTRACLKGRNPDDDALESHIAAYETRRNASVAAIDWRFSTQDAGTGLRRCYPCLSKIDRILAGWDQQKQPKYRLIWNHNVNG